MATFSAAFCHEISRQLSPFTPSRINCETAPLSKPQSSPTRFEWLHPFQCASRLRIFRSWPHANQLGISSGSAPVSFATASLRAEQSGPLAASSTAVWKSTHFLLKMTNCGCLNRASNVVPVQFSVCHSSVNRLSSSDGNAGLLNSAPKRDALFATFLHRPLIPASQAERLDQPFASSAQAPEELFKELTRIQQC